MPRKHRRVHHPRTNCRCPEGSKRVETCGKKGDPKCRGRNIGCIARVSLPGAKKPLPRFVKPVCDPEAGPVEQWKPPPGTKRKRKRKAKGEGPRVSKIPPPGQIPFHYSDEDLPLMRLIRNRSQPRTAEQIPFHYPDEDLPLLKRLKNNEAKIASSRPSTPPWWRT